MLWKLSFGLQIMCICVEHEYCAILNILIKCQFYTHVLPVLVMECLQLFKRLPYLKNSVFQSLMVKWIS